MFRVEREALQLLTPIDAMTVYRWGSGTAEDYFCPTCGILPFRKPSAPTDAERDQGLKPFEGWSVNARCIDGLDLATLTRIKIKGSQLVIPVPEENEAEAAT